MHRIVSPKLEDCCKPYHRLPECLLQWRYWENNGKDDPFQEDQAALFSVIPCSYDGAVVAGLETINRVISMCFLLSGII